MTAENLMLPFLLFLKENACVVLVVLAELAKGSSNLSLNVSGESLE